MGNLKTRTETYVKTLFASLSPWLLSPGQNTHGRPPEMAVSFSTLTLALRLGIGGESSRSRCSC
jgi:hypothetical protein